MVQMYYDKDCNLELLSGKTVAVIGYGSQGHAHAQNLKDSGVRVVIGLRPDSPRAEIARGDGFEVFDAAGAAAAADIVMMLTPDELQPDIFRESILPNLEEGNILAFAHGYSIHFNQIVPPKDVDVIMVAPKGPGHTVRSQYLEGKGVPSLIAIHQDASGRAREFALAYASGIGAGRAGIIETTFKEETETDLFGEQVDLCGGVTEMIKASFETLVDAGYQPEIAYFEACHELKLIVDLIYEGGFMRMWNNVSNTAEYGGMTRGHRIINEESRAEMQDILAEIQSGEFAREWILESQAGLPVKKSLEKIEAEHPIEQVGAELRAMMPWLARK